jgi:nitrate reductase gamma subunit
MSLILLMRLLVVLSAIYCLIALTVLVARTFSFGKWPRYAKAQGSSAKGIVYAFGQGMLPWEKESASKHLPTFFAGILYHAGIFAAIFFLIAALLLIKLPDLATQIVRLLAVIGLINGIGLLVKRSALPYMRFISCLDDYIANILVGLLLFFAILATYYSVLQPAMMAVAIILLLYIPVGKIRHCVFFFYSRILFGRFFGRRGTLPHPSIQD